MAIITISRGSMSGGEALATNQLTQNTGFAVTADNGTVVISGALPDAGLFADVGDRDRGEITRVVQSVDGVKGVTLNLGR